MSRVNAPSALEAVRAATTSPGTPAAPANPEVLARMAEFAELTPAAAPLPVGALDHLVNVGVTVTAELGRVTRTIGEVLKLGVGSVVELGRPIAEPVDLVVQGVRVGRGEVVVVNDRFAIRITEITDPKQR
jgi:flagellar motor switch protein FliN/FliY